MVFLLNKSQWPLFVFRHKHLENVSGWKLPFYVFFITFLCIILIKNGMESLGEVFSGVKQATTELSEVLETYPLAKAIVSQFWPLANSEKSLHKGQVLYYLTWIFLCFLIQLKWTIRKKRTLFLAFQTFLGELCVAFFYGILPFVRNWIYFYNNYNRIIKFRALLLPSKPAYLL